MCGSDLHVYYYPEAVPMDLGMPRVLGHEFSGTVVEVGEGVTAVAVGDTVAVYPLAHSCGECSACSRGLPFCCPQMASVGATAPGGDLAEYTTVEASSVHVLPDDVDLRMGALVEPMAVAWHGVARSGVQAGGSALIAGAGPIGIGTYFALRARGVEKILVSEPNPERRAIIERLGATVVDPSDLPAAAAALTGGAGVDVAIDAAGAGSALPAALSCLSAGGRVVVLAFYEQAIEFQPTQLMLAETEVVGAVGYTHEEFDEVIAAMASGLYDLTGWVQETGLEATVEAIEALRTGNGAKVLIRASE
ncbi:zinc-binding dehydrogenase [Tsukamurella sp. NPDC003166]|uniref:zinc-binding dehydrogenase n=1 Tax=Tsukamurella sp. NPDC003166 TaxID=3154444 RepID=UPI0033AEAC9E